MLKKPNENKDWYDVENLPEIIDYKDNSDEYVSIDFDYSIKGLLDGDSLTFFIFNKLISRGFNVYKSNSPVGFFNYKRFTCRTRKYQTLDLNKFMYEMVIELLSDKTDIILILYKIHLNSAGLFIRYDIIQNK